MEEHVRGGLRLARSACRQRRENVVLPNSGSMPRRCQHEVDALGARVRADAARCGRRQATASCTPSIARTSARQPLGRPALPLRSISEACSGMPAILLDPQHDVLEGQARIGFARSPRRDREAGGGQQFGLDARGDDFGIDEHAVAIENDKVGWTCWSGEVGKAPRSRAARPAVQLTRHRKSSAASSNLYARTVTITDSKQCRVSGCNSCLPCVLRRNFPPEPEAGMAGYDPQGRLRRRAGAAAGKIHRRHLRRSALQSAARRRSAPARPVQGRCGR